MPGYDYQNNKENYIANTSGGTTDVVENSPPTYSGMPTYNPMNPYSNGPSFVYESNPGAVQGDFRYEGINPALNPNASPDDYKVFDRPSMDQGLGMYYDANVDQSDWRVLQQIMGAGGNPEDYVQTAGLGSDIYNYLDNMLDFEGMKNQIPYMLDNLIPFYEPPEGYYDEDYEENLEMAEALTPDASFKILQGLGDKSPEYFYNTLPMIYGNDLWDETPMFNYGGDFYGNSELSWGRV